MNSSDYANLLEEGLTQLTDFKYKLAARKLIAAARFGELRMTDLKPEGDNPKMVNITLRNEAMKTSLVSVPEYGLEEWLARLDANVWEVISIE